MFKFVPQVSSEIVFDHLPKSIQESASVRNLSEEKSTVSLQFARKRFFRLYTESGPDIHLSFGRELEKAFERTKSFYGVLPKYTCKPLFLIKKDDFMLFGQEFFEGSPIDTLYEKSELTSSEVENILAEIRDIFAGLERQSTEELKKSEFDNFCKIVLSNDAFSKIDTSIIKSEIIPIIESGILNLKPTIRWSSGDLSARNILIQNKKNFKIIDFEFAHKTHFHQEDWIRLATFSTPAFKEISFINKLKKEISNELHLFHLLRQTILNRHVYDQVEYRKYLQDDLISILKKIFGKSKIKSQILEGFSTHNQLLEGIINNNAQKNAELLGSNAKLIDSINELADKNSQLLYDKNKISEENAQLRDKNSTLSFDNSEFKIKNAKLSEFNTEMNEKNIKLAENNAQIANENKKLAECNDQILNNSLRVQNELEGKIDKVLRIEKSLSWKITAPLRFLRRITLDKRFKKKLSSKERTVLFDKKEDYNRWILLYDNIDEQRLDLFNKQASAVGADILFSIVMPVHNAPIQFLRRAIESVLKQAYKNWELCISDDHSSDQKVISTLKEFRDLDSRIKINFRKKNGHISACSNSALKNCIGEYIVLLDHDDELRPHSLLRIAETLKKNSKIQFVYSDEDKIDEVNNRFQPYFKPDWNPDLLLSQNYICHLACIKKDLIEDAGGFRVGYEGSQDWDLFLRVTEKLKPDKISHIPEILYHWRSYAASTASSLKNKEYAIGAAQKSLNDYLVRNKIKGKISKLNERANYWKIKYDIPQKTPQVSIIIPTKDKKEILKVCVDSILSKTNYSNYEILIVDNDTTDPESMIYLENLDKKNVIEVIKNSGKFNYSRLNNNAAKHAKGEVLLLLNNDIEVVSEDWLEIMVSHAIRPGIGCVGAKLLYPNSTIQHAGVVLGIGGVAGHPYKGFPADSTGQFSRLLATQNFEAVTGACLAVKKSIFEEVGGLNEKDLKVAFNDVDFCLRVRELGYNNILDPSVVLFHHESYSRGVDTEGIKKVRFEEEVKYMYRKWGKKLQNDSFYSPNLSLEKEDFSLAFPPRVT